MKKNLMSVVILALVIVNVALTGIIMFSTVSANKKTIELVNNIASVLDLELTSPIEEMPTAVVSIENTDVYSIPDAMTIALRPSADGSEHYCMCQMSFSLDKSDADYQKYSSMVEGQQNKIKSIINDVIGGYTKEDVRPSQKAIEEEILRQVQGIFSSRFIYEAYFSDLKLQ